MSLYEFLQENYGENEPILISQIKMDGLSDANLRQQIKKLTDIGKLKKYDTGIYFIPKPTVFKYGSMISRDAVIEKKYLKDGDIICGYVSGIMFANQIGLTTQVPAAYEIVTNRATSDYRETFLTSVKVILRRPRVAVTQDNYKILQFLDLLKDVDTITEIEGDGLKRRVSGYMKEMMFTFSMLEPYLSYYPDKLYRNMYETGVLNGVSA